MPYSLYITVYFTYKSNHTFYFGNVTENDQYIDNAIMLILIAGDIIASVCTIYAVESNSDKSRRFVRLERHCVSDMFSELVPIYTHRSYCMTENEFWKLYSLLAPHYLKKRNCQHKRSNIGSNPDSIPNKNIDVSLRLSVAIIYFAGRCPLNIMCFHRIGMSDVYHSVW